ncbi:MAG: AraC family transcriptional regulator [Turicibacter sp.]
MQGIRTSDHFLACGLGKVIEMEWEYRKTYLVDEFVVHELMTLYYFEFAKDYVFEGERHDFWELVYVDKGEVEVMSEDDGYKLKQGEMMFHKPLEFHNLWANGVKAPNVMIISFICHSPAMSFFNEKLFRISDKEQKLLASIIEEAKATFLLPLDVPLSKLEFKSVTPFGSQQLIKLYLQQLLISLVRSDELTQRSKKISSRVKQRYDDHTISKIMTYLENNLDIDLKFEEVCKYTNLSQTHIKVLFKEKVGTGVMEYYKSLKVEKAKLMIREDNYNFTQIADKLGYHSIHTFSRNFKKATNMTPSEYARSVRV